MILSNLIKRLEAIEHENGHCEVKLIDLRKVDRIEVHTDKEGKEYVAILPPIGGY